MRGCEGGSGNLHFYYDPSTGGQEGVLLKWIPIGRMMNNDNENEKQWPSLSLFEMEVKEKKREERKKDPVRRLWLNGNCRPMRAN